MQRFARSASIVLVILMIGFSPVLAADSAAPTSKAEPVFADGVYLILREVETPKELGPLKSGETSIVYDYADSDLKPKPPARILVIKPKPDIPVMLEESPNLAKDRNGRPMLNISLSKESIEPLRKFTHDNLGGAIAMILKNHVVSTHKIREEIKEGKVQITRCSDSACEVLYLHLKDKVAATK